MKKIYITLFAVAALLAFAPAVSAQTPGPYSINGQINETVDGKVKYLEWPKADENGLQKPEGTDFAYSKDISAPQSDGTYWIKLESFSTGAASTILSSTPSDIILILDSSTSMNQRDYVTSSGTVTRIAALREATGIFIDNIADNDAKVTAEDPSFAGNRIAIVSFDNTAHVLTTDGWVDVGGTNAPTTLKNAVNTMSLANWTQPALGISSAIANFLAGTGEAHTKRADANLTVVLFTDGLPSRQSTGGSGDRFDATLANNAIYQSSLLKKTYGATVYTVGLISPTSTNEHIRRGRYFLDLLSSNYPDSYIANNSNSSWNIIGNNITISGMTIGDKDPDGNYYQLVDENTNLNDIFDIISKQSGGSSSQLSAASRNVDVVSNSFIIPGATQDNINSKVKVFIAKVSGYDTTKKEITFSEEIMTGHIPNEPVSDRTGYYYYPLDENGDIADDAVLTKVDATLSLSYNATTQAVTVTGFDYSSNFCGPIYKSGYKPSEGPEMTATDLANVDHWQGYKIIIMIPIKMNPDAVGGPDVPTNATGSGIYISNTEGEGALVQFKSPNVSLPVNIHLKKTGLGPGESAKFRIERALLPDPIPANFDPSTLTEWFYVSTVFVTRPQGAQDTDPDPIVKVRGLPANMDVTEGEGDDAVTTHQSFVYRVTEEDWSWSYTPDTPPQYTTTSNVTNPFTFSNTKEDNIDVKVRHAESKATNIFKPGVVTNNVKYDDSKTNTR